MKNIHANKVCIAMNSLNFTAINEQLKDIQAYLAEYEQHKQLITMTHNKFQSAGKK